MKTIYTFLFICFFITTVKAQVNLVPNPSFEQYTNCPNTGYKTVFLADWDLDFNTSDFYHECSTINYSIPNNGFGTQCARTGNAYIGLAPYSYALQADRREYIGGKLTDSLIVGVKYYVTFKVSLAEESPCAVNNFGIKFIANSLIDSNAFTSYIIIPPVFVDNHSQINCPTIITDSNSWTTIRGSFIADSAYINFLIGNFYSTINTDSIVNSGWATCQSYYYLDDVCISTDSLYCEDIKRQLITISADSNNINQNTCINFNLQTIIDYSTYEWHFDGGFPSTSNQMNPSNICYPNFGNYDVTFIGHKNGGCTDTLTISQFINVDGLTSSIDYFGSTKIPKIIFSDNVFKISNIDKNINYSIVDVLGRSIKIGRQFSDFLIDCNNFNAGVYILTFNNSSIKPIKFIINPITN